MHLVEEGTDALETDTLHSDVAALLDPSGLRREPIHDAVAQARNVATPNDRFVVGAVWVGFSLTLAREVSFDQVASWIAYQVRELSHSGVDAVHLPRVQDSMDLMAALDEIKSVEQELLSGEHPEDFEMFRKFLSACSLIPFPGVRKRPPCVQSNGSPNASDHS